MTVDKSLRQYYSRGQLVKPGPGRPGYQGWGPGAGSPGTSSGGHQGGGGQDHPNRGWQTYTAPAPAPAPAPSPHRDPTPVTTAVAPPSVLSRPTAYADPDPITETVPGDVTFEPEKTTLPTRNIHRDTKETKAEQDKLDIQQMIAKQQEEKYGVTADPTKFGETVEGPDLRSEKEKVEDWERSQDWDKVKDLADRGYDFKDIQGSLEKGLLTKTDPRSMQTNLLGRGLASLKNIIPKTGLEKNLLSKLTSSLNPKSMAMGTLKSMALKKLGLGFLNPFLGIASLFGFNPFKGLTSKFAKKPAFDIEEASKLGLYANRFPTDESGQFPTDKQYAESLVTPKEKPSTLIAKGTGLGKGYEMLGLHEGERDNVIDTPGDVDYASMLGPTLGKGAAGLTGRALLDKISKPKGLSSNVRMTYHGTPSKNLASIASKGFQGSRVPTWAGFGKTFTTPNINVASRYGNPINVLSSTRNLTSPIGGGIGKGGISFGSEVVQTPGQATKGMNIAQRALSRAQRGVSPTAARLVGGSTLGTGARSLAGRALGPIGAAYTVGDLLGDRATAMRTEADRISALQGLDQTQAIEDYATKMYRPYARGGRIDKPLMGRSRDI